MLENYNEVNLTANAYMIKEMGDGFLCSVGYPFKPIDKTATESSIKLAKRFIKEFTNFMISLELEDPVYCSVGVALGPVESSFSSEGVVRYDLFGNAIVMATRYESLRNQIFKKVNIIPSNIIIVQESIYKSLPPSMREDFVGLEIKQAGISIKDDPTATKLYFTGIAYKKSMELEAS